MFVIIRHFFQKAILLESPVTYTEYSASKLRKSNYGSQSVQQKSGHSIIRRSLDQILMIPHPSVE